MQSELRIFLFACFFFFLIFLFFLTIKKAICFNTCKTKSSEGKQIMKVIYNAMYKITNYAWLDSYLFFFFFFLTEIIHKNLCHHWGGRDLVILLTSRPVSLFSLCLVTWFILAADSLLFPVYWSADFCEPWIW